MIISILAQSFTALSCKINYVQASQKVVEIQFYTPQKKKLLAFSFANFETTRGSTGMAHVSFLSLLSSSINDYTAPKKLLPNFLKFKLNKQGVSFFGECRCPILTI